MDKPDHHNFNEAYRCKLLDDLKKSVRDLAPVFPDHIEELISLHLRNYESCVSYSGKQKATTELLKHIHGLRAYKASVDS